MAVRMQQRRATAEQWLLADPVLAEGEIGLETDTSSFKIGNGADAWSLLDYFETSAAIAGTIDDYVPLTQKGAALGVATLDGTGNVPVEQLGNVPATDLTGYATETFVTTAVSNLVDSAPLALDTLNELAAALGDDANFATTVTNSLAEKSSLTGTETLTNKTLSSATLEKQTKENISSTATGFAGYTFDLLNNAIQYITANSTANGTINFRASDTVTMNSFMSVGQSATCALLITNGATPYYPTAYQIDGVSITPKWQGGEAPTAGNANSIDIYTFTILKTADATYTLLASQTQFA